MLTLILFTLATFICFQLINLLSMVVAAHAGRLFGVTVREVSLGYDIGRTIAQWQGRHWKWKIGNLPLGGYVKFKNLEEDTADGDRRNCIEQKGVLARLIILLSGPISLLLVGALLLAIVSSTGSHILHYAPDSPKQIQPGSIPGLSVMAVEEKSDPMWVSTLQLARQGFLKFLLFQPLDGWGGYFGTWITGGAIGQASLSAWMGWIGVIAILSALSTLLPIGGMTGAQVVLTLAEAVLSRDRVQLWYVRYTLVTWIWLMLGFSRMLVADLLWLAGAK